MDKRYNFRINTIDGNCHNFNAMFPADINTLIDKIAPNGSFGSFATFTITDTSDVAHVFFYDRVVNIDIREVKVKE